MNYIYALRLINGKFYVGSTHCVYTALKIAFSKNTIKDRWLILHKPMYVDKIVYIYNSDEEYKYLLIYIRKYGVENVRGPLFDSITHERESMREVLESIKKE